MSQTDPTTEIPKVPDNSEGGPAKKSGSRGWSSPAAEEESKYLKSLQTLLAPKQAGPTTKKPGRDPDDLLKDATEVPTADGGSGSKIDKAGLIFIGFVLAAFVVILGSAYLVFFRDGDAGAPQGGGGDQAQEQAQQQAQTPNQGDQEGSAVPELGGVEPEPTGIVFQKPRVDGDKYSLTVGDYTWSGKVFETENSKQWVLEGTTAAHFTRAVDLPDEDGDGKKDWITTGVFGRAEPDQPTLHATFQRTRLAEKQQTTGTYQLIDGAEVVLEGTYTDQVTKDNPDDQPDEIVRYYMESSPGAPPEEATVTAYSYEAHPDALIPGLVGWEYGANGGANGGGNGSDGTEDGGGE